MWWAGALYQRTHVHTQRGREGVLEQCSLIVHVSELQKVCRKYFCKWHQKLPFVFTSACKYTSSFNLETAFCFTWSTCVQRWNIWISLCYIFPGCFCKRNCWSFLFRVLLNLLYSIHACLFHLSVFFPEADVSREKWAHAPSLVSQAKPHKQSNTWKIPIKVSISTFSLAFQAGFTPFISKSCFSIH